MKDHATPSPRLVWKSGRATWVVGFEAYYYGDPRRPYPPVLCETCGQPATGISFEMTDTTLPEDKFVNKLPGRPHHYCQEHVIDYEHR